MADNYVSYDAQTPSENEKVQARQNIGAMGLNSFDLYMNGAVPRPPVPPFFTQRIPNIVPGYTEFELINGLNHALLIEQTARQNTDLLLKENLEKETADRIQADNQLQQNITAEETARRNADSQLQQNITAEATARENADNQLQENITAEATARENADNQLQQNITAEETARRNADSQLQQNITAEATARENADNQLQENITAEATARENADTQLEGKIAGIQSDLATEKTNRENADTALQQAITDETTARHEDTETVMGEIDAIKAQGNVRYDVAQSLSNAQNLQAARNISAVGSYVSENSNIYTHDRPSRLYGGTFVPFNQSFTVGGFKITAVDESHKLSFDTYKDNSKAWNTVFEIPYLHNHNIILTDELTITITGNPTFTYPFSSPNQIAGLLGANAKYAVKRFFSGTLSITEAANVVTNCNVLEMYFLPFKVSATAGSSGSLKYKIVLEVTGVSDGSTHQVGDIITLYNKLWDNSYESVSGTVSA